MTLSLSPAPDVFSSACFLAPDNLHLCCELSDRESRLDVVWPDHDRQARGCGLRAHSSVAHLPATLMLHLTWNELCSDPESQTLLSVTGALNTCQDTSLLFLLAILTKEAPQQTQTEAHSAHLDLLPPNWQTHHPVFCCVFSWRRSGPLHNSMSKSLSLHVVERQDSNPGTFQDLCVIISTLILTTRFVASQHKTDNVRQTCLVCTSLCSPVISPHSLHMSESHSH